MIRQTQGLFFQAWPASSSDSHVAPIGRRQRWTLLRCCRRNTWCRAGTDPAAGNALDVAVIGGGPGGLAAANALLAARPGLRVAVLERSLLRPRGASLSVQPNGVRAIGAINLGLMQAVLRIHAEVEETRFYSSTGELLSVEGKGSEPDFIRTHGGPYSLCAWHELQAALARALPPGLLHTRAEFDRYEQGAEGVTLHFKGDQRPPVAARLLVGCDGGQSTVRQQLLGDGAPTFLGSAIWRGVTPRPPWWPGERSYCLFRQQRQVVRALPLPDGTVIWQAFAPWPTSRLAEVGGQRAAYIQDVVRTEAGEARKGRALEAFQGWCPEVRSLIADTDALAVTEHAQFYRSPDACQVWGRGSVSLLGDAAHLSTPFLSQGSSQAFEDALVLGWAVGAAHSSHGFQPCMGAGKDGATPEALRAYEAVRQPQAAFVHSQSVAMYEDFHAGRYKAGGSPPLELQRCYELGLWRRTFEPLGAHG